MTAFDNIIIGAGPGGYEIAAALAHRGESVLVVERDLLGGTCLNRGCIPTKCLCASADALRNALESAAMGVVASSVSFDYTAARERMIAVMNDLREGVAAQLSNTTIVNGEATLCGGRTIDVDGVRYEAAKRLVIATGSKPSQLRIQGGEHAVTSDWLLEAECIPHSVAIIGGGVIGMEFASILATMGHSVTVIEYCSEILPSVDPDIAKRLRIAMSRQHSNLSFHVSTAVESITAGANGFTVKGQGKKRPMEIQAELVVAATGRTPVVPRGSAKAGLELTDRGFIKVNERMETNISGVFAVGDVNGLSMLAHSASAQGRVAGGFSYGFDAALSPAVVFTHPEVAQVGLSENQLSGRSDVGDFRVVRKQYRANGKACAAGHPDGIVKLVINEAPGTLAGATIIGAGAGELIASASILIAQCIPLSEIGSKSILPHPSLTEIFNLQ